jgi:hypothetical protein
MSSFGGDSGDYSALSDIGSGVSSLGDTGNSYGFTSDLGNIDPNSGFNSLGAGLTGAGAGTIPNGYIDGASNYTPDGTTNGISAGSLNGNTSFTMPSNSTGMLNAQNLSSALGMGSKLAGGQQSGTVRPQGGSGRVAMHQVQFANPIANFAGSAGGSQMGNSLLALLAKYHPGAQ